VQKAPYGPHVATWHRLVQGAQGTMGIVTWASMRCELLPQLEEAFVVGSSDLEPLMEMAAWLIRLRMANECFLLSSTDLASIFAEEWPKDFKRLRAELPPWTLFYVIAGYDYYPEERVSSYLSDTADLAKRLGLDPAKSVGSLSARQIMKAVQQPCPDPYWKLRGRGACEDVMFLSPNDKAKDFYEIMCGLAGKAGYPVSDLGTYIQPMVQGCGCHIEFNLFYDPDNQAEACQVKDLADQATKTLMNAGAFFSRPYGDNARTIMNRDAASVAVLGKLKKVFDPNGIMNPGKLCF